MSRALGEAGAGNELEDVGGGETGGQFRGELRACRKNNKATPTLHQRLSCGVGLGKPHGSLRNSVAQEG